VVREGKANGEGDEQAMLEFETVTLVPIERQLIDAALLTEEEVRWLDSYHARVHEMLSPIVDLETAAWLAEATRPLGS
jgi:Xaa-Pro aminopeptidase